jgi:tight adherence protein C
VAANNIYIFSSLGTFVVILLIYSGIYQFRKNSNKKRTFVKKIKAAGHNMKPASDKTDKAYENKKSGRFKWFFLKKIGAQIVPENQSSYSIVKKKFLRAGIRDENAPSLFWGFKIIIPVIVIGIFAILRVSVIKIFSPQLAIVVGVTIALLGFYLPDLWLYFKTKNRSDVIFRSLPDALDLLVVCVEAGMGLDAAIKRVGDEFALSNKPLSDEFKMVNYELRAGKKRSDALRNLAERIDLDDVKSLTTLLIQTDKFGTSIAQALRVYSDTFRTKRFQRAEEIAAKIPLKLIFPLGLFIFPSMFVVTIGPAVIRIFQVLLAK